MRAHTTAAVVLHPAFERGRIQERLFGSFVEHLGRGVYGGIYEPGHAEADPDGFRGDVLRLVKELGVSVVRYPGGNFVSAYDWRDGIGPAAHRPVRLDPAWHSVETNAFGVDEFARWCRAADVEPMLAVNLGTGDLRSAMQLLEYANHPGGTTLSDERRANGHEEPYGVRMWCLGNEMDGPWQVGHMSAEEYGRLAARTAAAMRALDPDLELVVCGSSNDRMATFATWEREVLAHTVDLVDYISCHQYFRYDGDLAAFLSAGAAMDRYIETIAATVRHVQAATGSTRAVHLSFDEWNVWDWERHDAGTTDQAWTTAPALLEDRYTMADAVVVGQILISFLNHADVVRAASMAQLVNVIGPIVAEPDGPAWRQTTFFPFADVRRSAGMQALQASVTLDGTAGGAPVSVAAAHDADTGALDVYLAQRDPDADVVVRIDLRAFGSLSVTDATVLHHEDPFACNSRDTQSVAPTALDTRIDDGTLSVVLPRVSWATIRLVADHDTR